MSNDWNWQMTDGIAYGNLNDCDPDEPALHHFFINYELHVYSKTSLCEKVTSKDSRIYVMGIRQDCIEGFYDHWTQMTEPDNQVYFCKDCLEKVKKLI